MAEEEIKYTLKELEKDIDPAWKKFCKEYIRDWEKARSYMTAYPKSTYEAAAVSANRLLKNAKITQYIDFIKDDIAKEVGISKIRLVDELKKIALADISEIHEDWITRKEFGQIPSHVKAAIQEIQTSVKKIKVDGEETPIETEYVKIKLHDKRGAIQDILKAMGWNEPDQINLSGGINTLNLVKASESSGTSQD